MGKSNSQVNKEANNAGADTTLAVVDYRMGQLEMAVRDGFDKHDKKLDSLTTSFTTKEETASIQKQLDNWRWYFRALASAVFLAFCTAIAGLVVRK